MDQHSHFKKWGAAYLLVLLFVASLAGQFVAQLVEVGNEAREHGQAFQERVAAVVRAGGRPARDEARPLQGRRADMAQVQLDLTEIKQHLGIPPRDSITAEEVEDLRSVRSGERE